VHGSKLRTTGVRVRLELVGRFYSFNLTERTRALRSLMGRIYDKSAELALPGREEKLSIERERWRLGGWNGSEAVTRVEFQHRGEYLAEIGLRRADVERVFLRSISS